MNPGSTGAVSGMPTVSSLSIGEIFADRAGEEMALNNRT